MLIDWIRKRGETHGGPLVVTLYTTEGCHLCEQAEAVLQPLVAAGQIELNHCDIITLGEGMMTRLQTRIPVIEGERPGQDLGWPFTLDEARAFLSLS
jgi:hypothetical protein